jgi:hypothetical protein
MFVTRSYAQFTKLEFIFIMHAFPISVYQFLGTSPSTTHNSCSFCATSMSHFIPIIFARSRTSGPSRLSAGQGSVARVRIAYWLINHRLGTTHSEASLLPPFIHHNARGGCQFGWLGALILASNGWMGSPPNLSKSHAIARRTPKRTRDYPSPKPTLHRFFSYKPLFFFFNYHTIIEESDSDSEISNILSLDALKDHKPNEN